MYLVGWTLQCQFSNEGLQQAPIEDTWCPCYWSWLLEISARARSLAASDSLLGRGVCPPVCCLSLPFHRLLPKTSMSRMLPNLLPRILDDIPLPTLEMVCLAQAHGTGSRKQLWRVHVPASPSQRGRRHMPCVCLGCLLEVNPP